MATTPLPQATEGAEVTGWGVYDSIAGVFPEDKNEHLAYLDTSLLHIHFNKMDVGLNDNPYETSMLSTFLKDLDLN